MRAGSRVFDHEPFDLVLRHPVVAGGLADVDQLRGGCQGLQIGAPVMIGQPVDEHDVRGGERLPGGDRVQSRICLLYTSRCV